MKPFRFAVQAAGARDGDSWRTTARSAEELGYSALLMPDHIDGQWGPLVAMTVAAEATTTLNVGTLVLSNDYRNPVALAKEIATLDLVSGGRIEFGIGAGWRKSDYAALGIEFQAAGERIGRLAESIALIKEVWSTAAARTRGTHYSVDVPRGLPVPHTTPHPRITMGGGGRRMLSLAAREADIITFGPSMANPTEANGDSMSPQAFTERVEWVKTAAGPRWDTLELQCMVMTCRITDDRDKTLRIFAAASGTTAESLADTPLALVGTVDQICEMLQNRRARWGFHYWVIREHDMVRFAPVVSRLAGS